VLPEKVGAKPDEGETFVTVHVAGNVPPVKVKVLEYSTPRVAFGFVVGQEKDGALETTIVQTSGVDTAPTLSVTVTVRTLLPALTTFALATAPAEESVKPAGSAEVFVHVYPVPDPPVALKAPL